MADVMKLVVVDDEPVARRRVLRLLKAERDVQVVAQCADGDAALQAITALGPDVVLLDVQMPVIDGFGVVQALRAENPPLVIFATAYDHYALKAFEVHALDYLLKPITHGRLSEAIERCRRRLQEQAPREVERRIDSLISALALERKFLSRVPVRVGSRVVVLELAEVDWIGSADNYVTLHAGPREYLLRDTMARLERELDPEQFVRIHRSAIVRIDRVRELLPELHGDFTVVLKDGTNLTLSRTFRENLENLLRRRF